MNYDVQYKDYIIPYKIYKFFAYLEIVLLLIKKIRIEII